MDIVKRRKAVMTLLDRVTCMAWIWTVPLVLTYLLNTLLALKWLHYFEKSPSWRKWVTQGLFCALYPPSPCFLGVTGWVILLHHVPRLWWSISPQAYHIELRHSGVKPLNPVAQINLFFPLNYFSFSQLYHLIAMKDLTSIINIIRDIAASESTPGLGDFK